VAAPGPRCGGADGDRLRPLDLIPVAEALAWVDAATGALETEEVGLADAVSRVLAGELRAAQPVPAVDRAAIDGYALDAAASLGAGNYNPITVAAVAVEAGERLPEGTDAVVPLDLAEPDDDGTGVTVVEPVATGSGVMRTGSVAEAGDVLTSPGTVLSARHIGLLAVAGIARVAAIRRPRVRLCIGAVQGPAVPIDGNSPMLRALIKRDGATMTTAPLANAFGAGSDLVLIAGGTGRGRSDRSAALLAAAGSLDIHGVAVIPGETAGFGRTAEETPALLLPGIPAACLFAYELFAGRAIRRLGGRNPRLPYRSRLATTARKIVSAIGMTEICPVRSTADGKIEALPPFAEAGVMSAAIGDGFVVVPAASEGFPAGSQVRAYFYDQDRDRAEIVP
jgi:molybdopterin molybdotransferase